MMSEPDSGSPVTAAELRERAILAGQELSREVQAIARGLDFDIEPSGFIVALEEWAGDADEVGNDAGEGRS
ncbi:MAG: hypothetical protein KDF64_21660 [Geminicoccaceae bacterium]|nr:hypothetical protein [Geminicoccaceae bacterium]